MMQATQGMIRLLCAASTTGAEVVTERISIHP